MYLTETSLSNNSNFANKHNSRFLETFKSELAIKSPDRGSDRLPDNTFKQIHNNAFNYIKILL